MRRVRSVRRPEADLSSPRLRQAGLLNGVTFQDAVSLAAILMFVGGAVFFASTVAQIVILMRLQ